MFRNSPLLTNVLTCATLGTEIRIDLTVGVMFSDGIAWASVFAVATSRTQFLVNYKHIFTI